MRSMDVFFDVLNVEFSISCLETEIGESETILNEIKKKINQPPSTEMRSILRDKLNMLENCVL